MNSQRQAEEFIRNISSGSKVFILYHGDADGVCSAVIIFICLKKIGIENISPFPFGRGENPFSENMHRSIMESMPDYLIILDSGSRSGSFPDIKCLIIDHHIPDDLPTVDVFFNTWQDKSNRITSEAAFDIANNLCSDIKVEWYALTGVAGDSGITRVSQRFLPVVKKYGSKVIQECISLINAARRHSSFRISEVFDLLLKSDSPINFLATAKNAGIGELKKEVNQELKKNLKVAPRFHDNFVLLNISSPHQIHPLLATIWSNRIKGYVIIAANWGYLSGKVCFSVRTESEIDLISLLKKYRKTGEEIGFGHSKATGGIVEIDKFRNFLRRLGFE